MKSVFVERFAAAWKQPSAERLVALLHRNVVLYQPQAPPIRGKAAAHREFQRLLQWLPGLCGTVDRSCGDTDVVFIEWHMHIPIGRGINIRVVDRFVLQDGVGIERAVYFDPQPLLLTILTHPGVWLGFVRYRFGRR